jgi:WD40 repeat protein
MSVSRCSEFGSGRFTGNTELWPKLTDVYLAGVLAQGKQLGALRRFTLDDRNDWPSAWTPDSKAVLFVSNRDGLSHIFRQAVEATHADLLIGGNDNLEAPQLTPDGLSALYVAFPSSGKATDNSRLMRVSLSGRPSELALEEPGIGGYKCARLPSSVCIYSRVDNGVQRFFTFDPAGGKVKELPAAKRRSDDGPGAPGAFRRMAGTWRAPDRQIRMSRQESASLI